MKILSQLFPRSTAGQVQCSLLLRNFRVCKFNVVRESVRLSVCLDDYARVRLGTSDSTQLGTSWGGGQVEFSSLTCLWPSSEDAESAPSPRLSMGRHFIDPRSPMQLQQFLPHVRRTGSYQYIMVRTACSKLFVIGSCYLTADGSNLLIPPGIDVTEESAGNEEGTAFMLEATSVRLNWIEASDITEIDFLGYQVSIVSVRSARLMYSAQVSTNEERVTLRADTYDVNVSVVDLNGNVGVPVRSTITLNGRQSNVLWQCYDMHYSL